MEAVSNFDLFSLILCVEFAGMSLAASPTEGVSPLVLRFRALFVFLSFTMMVEGKVSVCGRGLGD